MLPPTYEGEKSCCVLSTSNADFSNQTFSSRYVALHMVEDLPAQYRFLFCVICGVLLLLTRRKQECVDSWIMDLLELKEQMRNISFCMMCSTLFAVVALVLQISYLTDLLTFCLRVSSFYFPSSVRAMQQNGSASILKI